MNTLRFVHPTRIRRTLIVILCAQAVATAASAATTVLPATIETGGGSTVWPVVVEATGSWTVTEDLSWLSVSSGGGSGNGDFDILVERNTSGQERSGTITVGDAVVAVTQRAAGSGLRELWRAGGGSPWNQQLPHRPQPPVRNVPVVLDSDVAVAAVGDRHFIYAKSNQTLWGMGYAALGPLGYGEDIYTRAPKRITSGAVSVAAGYMHSLFLKSDHTLWGMGGNLYIELGLPDGDSRESPVLLRSDVQLAAAGGARSLFVTTWGVLAGMGSNDSGALGRLNPPSIHNPVYLAGDVIVVATGGRHTLFVTEGGTLWATGDNSHGQLGVPPGTDLDWPAVVTSDVVAVAAGGNHSLFIKADGTLWAMGANDVGQLGDGTTIDRTLPVLIATDVVSVAAGSYHSLFIKADGSLWSMGANWSGELCDSTPDARATPAQVASNVKSVAAGLAFTLFITADEVSAPPVVTSAPIDLDLVAGGRATFAVDVSGAGTHSYQWLKDGVNIPGATAGTYSIANVQSSDAGTYSVVVSNSAGSVTADAGTLTVDPSPRLVNISTRARAAGYGEVSLIVGFVIEGTGAKTVLIRGVGPELVAHGVSDIVEDPSIHLFSGDTLIAFNDDWSADLKPDFAAVGAFPLPIGSTDAALKATLPPGAYTIHLVNPGLAAEALVEVYDFSMHAGSRLINLSARLALAEGETAVVGTVLVNAPVPVVVRAIGPGLEKFGVDPFMADPQLRVYSGQGLIASNNDWDESLADDFAAVGAFPIEAGSADSAVRLTLTPGGHTFHASAEGSEGVVLIELYESR